MAWQGKNLFRYCPNAGSVFVISVGKKTVHIDPPFAFRARMAVVSLVAEGREAPLRFYLNPPRGSNAPADGPRGICVFTMGASDGLTKKVDLTLEPHGASWSVAGGIITLSGVREFCPCCPLPEPGMVEVLARGESPQVLTQKEGVPDGEVAAGTDDCWDDWE